MKQSVLKLDFDTRGRRKQTDVRNRLWLLSELFPRYRFQKERWTKSRHGWHCEIVVKSTRAVPLVMIVALQLVLGSDSKREAFNLARATQSGVPKFWRERGNVLYSRKLK